MEFLCSFSAYPESWIEVSSQPSSSSLSSATADEIITTGLRVTQSMNARRRRRLHRSLSGRLSEGASSQEEYEESDEGDSDQVLSSSNEDIMAGFRRNDATGRDGPHRVLPPSNSFGIQSTPSDDDENATAIGVPDTNQVFTPQPNAFTHPPSVRATSSADQDSYFTNGRSSAETSQTSRIISSTSPVRQPAGRPAHPRAYARGHSHTPYNMISPNHTVPIDHDAALRASLSTLLSCAAAARGLPKRETMPASTSSPAGTRTNATNNIEQGTLRLVPGSCLDTSPPAAPLPRRGTHQSPCRDMGSANKRKSKSPSHDRRKKRRPGTPIGEDDLGGVSPTLMTWVVGAGVMVLFSAISFSAGYALGKEVSRLEMAEVGGASLGRVSEGNLDLGRGLRSRGWRWGNTSGVRA
jgi:hypothetical protein